MGYFVEFEWQTPFHVRESGTAGCEVRDANHIVVCWTSDLPTALLICSLLDEVFETESGSSR